MPSHLFPCMHAPAISITVSGNECRVGNEPYPFSSYAHSPPTQSRASNTTGLSPASCKHLALLSLSIQQPASVMCWISQRFTSFWHHSEHLRCNSTNTTTYDGNYLVCFCNCKPFTSSTHVVKLWVYKSHKCGSISMNTGR
jgi:hypothetical protein